LAINTANNSHLKTTTPWNLYGVVAFFLSQKISKRGNQKVKNICDFLFCETRYSVLDDVLPTQ